MQGKWIVAVGALLAALGVTAGAVGTHVLKERLELPAAQIETYATAVDYQVTHALGLILVGILVLQAPSRLLAVVAAAFFLGTLLFSGGIYAWLATDSRTFIQIVPIGGTIWILGWLLLVVAALRLPRRPSA